MAKLWGKESRKEREAQGEKEAEPPGQPWRNKRWYREPYQT